MAEQRVQAEIFDFERGELVEVCWIDSSGSHGWNHTATEIAKPDRVRGMYCRTVGWVLHDDEDGLMLSGSLAAIGSHCCDMTIPHLAIISRQRLVVATEPVAAVNGQVYVVPA